MSAWIDFAAVGLAELTLFFACAFFEKRIQDIPRLLSLGIIIGIPLGLLSDLVLWGTYTYPLGYGLLYLVLNAAVVYGLFAATILLLQRARLVRFSFWIAAMIAIYEATNHFFLVWTYEITPFLGLLAFVVGGYFVTALAIALGAHVFFGYRFSLLDSLAKC